MVHFQNQKSRKDNVSHQTLVRGNSTLRHEEGKAVPDYHSDVKWNGIIETCIKIEDFFGVYFSHETKLLLIHKTMPITPQGDIKSYLLNTSQT